MQIDQNNLAALLNTLQLGPVHRLGALRVVPLFGEFGGPDVLTLKEAIDAGNLTLTELDASGSVNSVRARNDGDRPVLLLDGDELLGAKQNRVLNASTILGPASESMVEVSCIERGRWAWTSKQFDTNERTIPPSLRSRKARRVSRSRSVRATGRFDADQRAVWRDVADMTLTRGSVSRTSALSEILDQDSPATSRAAASIACEPRQTGVAVLHGSKLLSIDVLGSGELYARCHGRLLRGIASECLLHGPAPVDRTVQPLATLKSWLRCALLNDNYFSPPTTTISPRRVST